jgi:hypothetical protein
MAGGAQGTDEPRDSSSKAGIRRVGKKQAQLPLGQRVKLEEFAAYPADIRLSGGAPFDTVRRCA